MAAELLSSRPLCHTCDAVSTDGDIITHYSRARHVCAESSCCWVANSCDALLCHYRFFKHRMVCEGCFGTFASLRYLSFHLKLSNACENCHTHFKDSKALAQHGKELKQHCEDCGYIACTSNIFKSAVSLHAHPTEEFMCADCHIRHDTAKNLLLHRLKIHHACICIGCMGAFEEHLLESKICDSLKLSVYTEQGGVGEPVSKCLLHVRITII